MEIQQLRGFIAAARLGNISSAAQSTGRTQPAVSLQIKLLAEEFHVQLFQRAGRKLALTEEGRLLADLVAPLLQEFDDLPRKFEERRTGTALAPLRVATHASVMTYILPDVVKQFRRKNPKVELTLISRSRGEIIEMVKNGEVDIGITSLSKAQPNLAYLVFGRYPRVLLCPKDHPLAKGRKLTLEEVGRYPLILGPRPSETRIRVEQALTSAGESFEIAIEVTNREAAKKYGAFDMGLVILNEYCVTTSDRRNFTVKDVSHLFGYAERGVLYRRERYLSRGAKELLELLGHSVQRPS